MVCGGDDQTVRCVFLKELQERIENSADFANVIRLITMSPESVKFVEQIDTLGLTERVEDEPEFRRSLSHEFRNQPFQHDGEKGQVQFSRKSGGRHCFAGTGGAYK